MLNKINQAVGKFKELLYPLAKKTDKAVITVVFKNSEK